MASVCLCFLRLQRDEWGEGGSQESPRLHRELDETVRWWPGEQGRNGGQSGMLGKESEGEAGGDGERARGRLTAVVCIFWVSFNSINVPGWRQEGSSIIKLIEMRSWARNLKAIYRGTRVSSGEGVRSRSLRQEKMREGHVGAPGGAAMSGVYFKGHHCGPSPSPAPAKAVRRVC